MMKLNSTLTSALIAGAVFAGAQGLFAADGAKGHGHDHGKGHSHAHAAAETPASANAAVMSSHDGMTALYAHLGELEKGLQSGNLDSIHNHSEALPAAVKDLHKDTSLDAAKKKRVQGYVKNVLRQADKLHHHADGKKLDLAKKEFKKLMAQVDLLDKQFAHSHKPGAATAPAHPAAPSVEKKSDVPQAK
jgi:hypothetical protein